jgi:hypothetical protein
LTARVGGTAFTHAWFSDWFCARYDDSVSWGSEIRSAGGKHMFGREAVAGSLVVLLMSAGAASAGDKEPTAIVEIGGAGEWSFTDHAGRFGPTAAVEVTPIPEWLEIEAGVTSLFSRGGTEWSADLVLKKPFTLSDKVEFMVGIGPEWKINTGSVAAEGVLDFMFWPTADRKLGWFLEPSYSYDLGSSHEKSLGLSAGILIPIP